MMRRLRPLALAVIAPVLAGAVALAVSAAAAQNVQNNALQGFSQNRDQPVKIDAATLEVRDKDKVATFSGNVHLVQGDTTMRCKTLVVFYEQDSAPGGAKPATMKSATPVGPGGGSQSIKRLEARGNVIVTQKDQTATGETGIFDMKANTVTLHSSPQTPVVISQGQNVVKGDRLIVNLTTGVSRVECNNPRDCRVSALLTPNAGNPARPDGGAGAAASGGAGTGTAPHGRGGGAAPRIGPSGPSGVY